MRKNNSSRPNFIRNEKKDLKYEGEYKVNKRKEKSKNWKEKRNKRSKMQKESRRKNRGE